LDPQYQRAGDCPTEGSPVKKEIYISVDIESAGPIPGKFSMLSLGACVVNKPAVSFYAEFKPISSAFVPAAMAISGFDLKKLRRTGVAPKRAMSDFARWIEKIAGKKKAVFVGFNGAYDWQFVNWYFETYVGRNPFGFGGIDIKSYYMGMSGLQWGQTTSSQLPAKFQPEQPQTHNALDDAQAQASIFQKMRATGASEPGTKRPEATNHVIETFANGSLPKVDLAQCLRLLEIGGAVNIESAAQELPVAPLVTVHRDGGNIVAVGAIKRKRPPYAEGVAKKSGVQFDDQCHEIGYVVVAETHGNRGLSKAITSKLLSEFGDRPLFATTSNNRMKRSLTRAGFTQRGKEWNGKSPKLSLWMLGEV
jgi:ribonuclease T